MSQTIKLKTSVVDVWERIWKRKEMQFKGELVSLRLNLIWVLGLHTNFVGFTPYLLCAYDDVEVRKLFCTPRRMLLQLSVQSVPRCGHNLWQMYPFFLK